MKIQPGTFAKHAAETDSVLDYVRALNPLAVAMEAPAGERVSRQLGGWARGLGGGALGGLLGGFGGRELGGALGYAHPSTAADIVSHLPVPPMPDMSGGTALELGEYLRPKYLYEALVPSAPAGEGFIGAGARKLRHMQGLAGALAGGAVGAATGGVGSAALGGLRGHVSAIRSARAARRAQEAAERSARAMADLEAAKRVGGALGDMGERAVGALKRNPLLAGLGAGALGAYAMS